MGHGDGSHTHGFGEHVRGGGGGGGIVALLVLAGLVLLSGAGAALAAVMQVLVIGTVTLVALGAGGGVAWVVWHRRALPRSAAALPRGPSRAVPPWRDRPEMEGGQHLHIHFDGVSPQDVAAIIAERQDWEGTR